ncbi:hypothetical protein PR202_gb06194 [Eleusine coracana subsp. coracana]|uniref:Uncharacterized protein n=1 Tax=Eleusine coracana subsp. coracana TaxID=191504 RepID=A0AAV5E8X9_ELECO|nr:hypothetical protein PR202_gb06194 [Eleusine coracana subsp. coracana]
MAGDELPPAAAVETAADEDLVEILEEESGRLDIARYVDHVRDLSAGAIATFEGTTRDHFAGRRVVELRYEAYSAMARRRMAAILRQRVFVAASATHRADAMEACRYVIDEIKASVPIWKKEVYDDGEVWKENSEFFERHADDPAAVATKRGGCCGNKVRVQEA